jgi:hypothetical protein
MNLNSSESKKVIKLATSSGLPQRGSAIRLASEFFPKLVSDVACAATLMGVLIGPLASVSSCDCVRILWVCFTYGAMELTRVWVGPASLAADFVNPITPCLLAEYAALYGRPTSPAMLAALTMLPPPSMTRI